MRGVRPEDFRARTPLSAAIEGPADVRERYRGLCRADDDKPIDWGSVKDFGKDFSVVVGHRLADLLKVKVGDRLQLVSPVEVATPLGVVPRAVPMVESMVALVLADHLLIHYAQCELLERGVDAVEAMEQVESAFAVSRALQVSLLLLLQPPVDCQ